MSTNVKNAPVALNLRGVLGRMKGVPVAPSAKVKSAGYSPCLQYFSKAPGFMLTITEATAIVRQRMVRLTRLRAVTKRMVRLTKLRVARNQKANSVLGWVPEDEPGIG
jgi:hypothetical protein